MAVTVQITGWQDTATCIQLTWHSDDQYLEELLNTLTNPYQWASPASPSVADPDLVEAKRVVQLLGGKVLEVDPVDRSQVEPGDLY